MTLALKIIIGVIAYALALRLAVCLIQANRDRRPND